MSLVVALWRPHTSFLPELSFAKKVLLALVPAERVTEITHSFLSLTFQVIEDAACRMLGLLSMLLAARNFVGKLIDSLINLLSSHLTCLVSYSL